MTGWHLFATQLLDALDLPRLDSLSERDVRERLLDRAARLRERADGRERVVARVGDGGHVADWVTAHPPRAGEHIQLDDGRVLAVVLVSHAPGQAVVARCRVVFDPREVAF